MSLKAKLEAVIYAAEEPVTLTQLAALFVGDALEWKAAQQVAAAEQAAEVAAENSAEPFPLLAEGLEYLGLEDSPEVYATATAIATAPEAETDTSADSPQDEATKQSESTSDAAEDPTPVDAEADARRLARSRDREVKGVLKQLLDELIADYTSDGRGVEIREIAGGYRMATKPACHDAVRLFVKSLKPPMKLSLPALETLAVVAYKQPVTSPEVSEIRGVESGGVLGSLLARKLIATAGRKPVIGRPILYKTTREFLLRFGLKDLAELPSMEEFEKMAAAEIEELEPEIVAADAAEFAAELEENSPSGEELGEAADELELQPGNTPALLPGVQFESGQVESDKGAASETTPSSNQPEPSADTPVEVAGAAPEPSAGNPVPPAEPQEEIETVPHAEKDQEDR